MGFKGLISPYLRACLSGTYVCWAVKSWLSLFPADLAVGGGRAEAASQHHQTAGDVCGTDREAGGAIGPQATAYCTPRGSARCTEGLR